MAATAYTFTASEFDVQFQSPSVSQSLDRALGTFLPAGIHRGFRIDTSTTPMQVSVNANINATDHAAVYRTADGYAVVVRRLVASFSIDLTAFANQTVIVAIFATYSPSAATTAIVQVMS